MAGSTHVVSGSYEPIAKPIFTGLDYDTCYLEYDTERAGDFEPLRHLPVGKNVVLGVVSTKMSELERIENLVAKVNAAADVIAKGQGRGREEVIQTLLGVSPAVWVCQYECWRRTGNDNRADVGETCPCEGFGADSLGRCNLIRNIVNWAVHTFLDVGWRGSSDRQTYVSTTSIIGIEK